jgi:hypothetical protein
MRRQGSAIDGGGRVEQAAPGRRRKGRPVRELERRRATRWWRVVAAGALAADVVAVAPPSPAGATART